MVSGLLAFGVSGALIAGCGSSGGALTSGLLGASSPISRAQAVAYADAVNLVAADVPGLQATQHQPKREAAAGPYEGAMNSCDNTAVRAGDVIGFSSPTFDSHPSLPPQSHPEGLPTAGSVQPVP
jgi:hypothetical protein